MVKKLVLISLLSGPVALKAGWLDDMVLLYNETASFQKDKALALIESYREKDEQKQKELERCIETKDYTSFWGKVRGGSYQAELALVRSQIEHYKKVARTMREFPENKKEEESFVRALKKLSRHKQRLEELRAKYRKSSGMFEKAKIGAVIAAQSTKIAFDKAYIKNILL